MAPMCSAHFGSFCYQHTAKIYIYDITKLFRKHKSFCWNALLPKGSPVLTDWQHWQFLSAGKWIRVTISFDCEINMIISLWYQFLWKKGEKNGKIKKKEKRTKQMCAINFKCTCLGEVTESCILVLIAFSLLLLLEYIDAW